MKPSLVVALLAPITLAACATNPSAPPAPSSRVGVMPGPKKSLAAFDADERRCRQWADEHLDTTPGDASVDATARGALGGAALGAGTGALIGSTSGHVGQGAVIGAASGLVLGTLVGAANGDRAAGEQQRRYDIAYAQCMKAAGNTVDAPAPVQVRREVIVEERRPVVVYEEDPIYVRRYRRY